MSNVAATGVPVSAGVEGWQGARPPGHGVPVHIAILAHTSRDDHRVGVGVWDGAGRPEVLFRHYTLVGKFSAHQVSRTRSNPVSTLPSCLTISVVFLLDPPPISTNPASEAQDTWSYLGREVHVPGYTCLGTRGRTSPPAAWPPAATGPCLCRGRGRRSGRGRRRRGGRPPGCARRAGRAAPAAGTRPRWRGGTARLTGDRPGRLLSGWLEICHSTALLQ